MCSPWSRPKLDFKDFSRPSLHALLSLYAPTSGIDRPSGREATHFALRLIFLFGDKKPTAKFGREPRASRGTQKLLRRRPTVAQYLPSKYLLKYLCDRYCWPAANQSAAHAQTGRRQGRMPPSASRSQIAPTGLLLFIQFGFIYHPMMLVAHFYTVVTYPT